MPGPQFPLYVLGREMQELSSRAVPRAESHALAIAIMSYNGQVDFGLLGDYDAMADLEEFAGDIEDSVAELLDSSRASRSAEQTVPAT